MNKEKVMEYVMETPGNTNPNVLRSLLDSSDDNHFIVTLTPTAEDFSGTMDKTVAEIYEAYQSGKRIVFRVMTEDGHMDVDCTARWSYNEITYPSFNGFILMNDGGANMLVFAATGVTNDGTAATYFTTLYSLTPAN